MINADLHPAQGRALAYIRRKGTEARGEQVRAKLGATFDQIESLLDDLEPTIATRRPDERTWCLQEVVDHLIVSLEPAVEQLQALIDGDTPGDAVPASLLSDDPFALSWEDTVARLRGVHRSFLETVDAAVAADPPPERKAPVVMVVKVEGTNGEPALLEWVEWFDWKAFALVAHIHTLEHVHQIERIRRQLGERPEAPE